MTPPRFNRFGRTPVTTSIRDAVRHLCAAHQGTDAFTGLHALLQANLLSATMVTVQGPPPDRPDGLLDWAGALEQEAADLRCAADGAAQFLEHLADRIRQRQEEQT